MYNFVINESYPRDMALINEIEVMRGCYITWDNDCIILSADTEKRLRFLVTFFKTKINN